MRLHGSTYAVEEAALRLPLLRLTEELTHSITHRNRENANCQLQRVLRKIRNASKHHEVVLHDVGHDAHILNADPLIGRRAQEIIERVQVPVYGLHVLDKM